MKFASIRRCVGDKHKKGLSWLLNIRISRRFCSHRRISTVSSLAWARRLRATTRVAIRVLIAVLRGAVVFMGDLMRKIELPTNIDFMAVSSYGDGVKSSGIVRIIKDLDIDIRGRDVPIVEDILDSGLTLKYLMKNLESRKPASLRSPPSCGRTLRTASRPSRPSMLEPIALMPLWWATASTMPSAIATFRIWAF